MKNDSCHLAQKNGIRLWEINNCFSEKHMIQ